MDNTDSDEVIENLISALPTGYDKIIKSRAESLWEHVDLPHLRWRFAHYHAKDSLSLWQPMRLNNKTIHFIEVVREMGALLENDGEKSIATDNVRLAVEDLQFFPTIAECGSEYLFLNPRDNHSVWVFWHDGPIVRLVAPNIDDWFAKAAIIPKLDGHATPQEEPVSDVPNAVLGRWKPISSPTLSARVIERLPDFEVLPNGIWRRHQSIGRADCEWTLKGVNPLLFEVLTPTGPVSCRVELDSKDTLTMTTQGGAVVYHRV